MTAPNVPESGKKEGSSARKRRKRRRASSVTDYAFSAAMVLALAGFWSVWLSPSNVEGKVDSDSGLRVRYLSPAERITWRETRRWPTILMSVPTGEGFSGDVLVDRLSLEPKLDNPVIEILYLERKSSGEDLATPDAGSPMSRDVFPAEARGSRYMPMPPPRSTLPATVRPEFEIVFSQGLDKSDFLRTPLPESLVRGDAGWWLARFWVELGAEGEVHLALLEEGTGQPDLDRALVRTIHRWRGRGTGQGIRGEVRIGSVGREPIPGDEE